ncbi:major facilitator superfamily transporter [Daldinia decipiens]|uniref:major facilitator superfamily transporter n=1 Tax=Daldinia decipiens TaxID=326647 RepID=UPI0020C41334|nr:major facilitator superfamily transporter [Daldinia decipiens]KAI1652686.1 major facilitator superfamily transporter [Daldinia decipiens]
MELRTNPTNRSEDTETLAPISSDSSLELQISRPELPLLRFWLFSIGLLVGLLLSFLDTSIVATSIFAIATEFGDLASINWVALAYSLVYLGCASLLARVSDIIGRRNAFIASYLIFIAFSIACGFAHNLVQLIACRALQGLGGSGLYSITMIILPEVAPGRIKRFIGGLVGIVITMSSVLGPVLGGVLTEYTTWRWVFWINGPIGVVSVLLFYFTWPAPQYLPNSGRRSWRELDYIGSMLLIAAAVLVVLPFQNAAMMEDQWSKPVFIAPLIIGVISWLGLFAWSVFIDRQLGDVIDAALPMRLLRDRVYAAAVLNTLFLGFPYMLIVYAFPIRLQVVNDKSALLAGVMLLPMLGSSAVGSLVAGALNGKKDRIFETLFVATSLVILGCGLLSTLSNSSELEQKALGFLVFVGLGFGMVVSTATMVATFHSSVRDHAPAQGLMAQVRVLGGSIGIAASSAILGVKLQELSGPDQPGEVPLLESGSKSQQQAQLEATMLAYAGAFKEDMRVCTIIGAVAILLTFGTFSRNRLTVAERRAQQMRERFGRKKTQSSQAFSYPESLADED